ncbi:DUF721 domain-containing protein [Flavobacterium silvaticum]|uniref:DUF721 domain-containing protein n=1 Tax=Flavobacterium silvaticum TaxID=1852020 RepID=A0A972FX54_9FLAO|nr:DUF721 domain-containing protein [Flavobacterium silvaticum]NMH29270.1 DUF721 domain-containing protein [Flavobacterium silvaticum]
MAKRLSNDSPIGDVLKQIIDQNKLQPGMDQIAVEQAWLTLLGNGVKSYTRKVTFRNGTIYAELTSAVLREELSYGKSKIIAMINEELKREVVKEVVLR